MIYLTKQQLCAIYGASSVSLKRRFNADDSSFHDDDNAAYKYEFGYLNGLCIYAIVQKEQGGSIAPLESDMLMASSGDGQWNLRDAENPKPDATPSAKKPASPPKTPAPVQPVPNPMGILSYVYEPVAKDPFYPTHLFASHQLERQQLVIFHPKWQVELQQIASDPI